MAREGLPFIIPPLAVALAAALAGGWFITVPLAVFGLFALWFFRDPDRTPPPGERIVVSPADGRILKIEDVDENHFLHRPVKKISIFMSVFNVHVNRAPVSGRIEKIEYCPGKFFNASLDKASCDNERNALVIRTADGIDVLVVQVAGLIARRIACWVRPGDETVRGRRFGLIRFGSRLEVYLPADAPIVVKPGQIVKAGVSVLGELPRP